MSCIRGVRLTRLVFTGRAAAAAFEGSSSFVCEGGREGGGSDGTMVREESLGSLYSG